MVDLIPPCEEEKKKKVFFYHKKETYYFNCEFLGKPALAWRLPMVFIGI